VKATDRPLRTRFILATAVAGLVALYACVEPPPKISAIPSQGLALKVFVFGASAQDARRAFEAVRQNNQSFSVVNEGGDGEVLVGLENDSPKCVPPTALCQYRVAFRVRNYKGEVVQNTPATTISASSDRCMDLCAKALNNMVVKVVEAAAVALKSGAPPPPVEPPEAGVEDAAADAEVDAAPPPPEKPPPRGKKPPPKKPPEPPPPPKAVPPICTVATGPRLASEDAEKRAAQVEVLKRINVIDQDEYDCLRKAYLDRL
jgi:hypothetical protein